jgi:hypothetical protein
LDEAPRANGVSVWRTLPLFETASSVKLESVEIPLAPQDCDWRAMGEARERAARDVAIKAKVSMFKLFRSWSCYRDGQKCERTSPVLYVFTEKLSKPRNAALEMIQNHEGDWASATKHE